MFSLALGCGQEIDVSTEALDFSCSANIQRYCVSLDTPTQNYFGCCQPSTGYFSVAYCCPEGAICCPGPEPTEPHCCGQNQTCKTVWYQGNFIDALCVPAICGPLSVPFNGLEQCCGGKGTPVAKKPITDLADCPDRISKPGYTVPRNGCGTKDHPLPSNWGKADFTPACNDHDTCYGTCPGTKQACDDKLLSDMDAICVKRFSRATDFGDRWGCRTSARKFGQLVLSTARASNAYDVAQKDGCQCCL